MNSREASNDGVWLQASCAPIKRTQESQLLFAGQRNPRGRAYQKAAKL